MNTQPEAVQLADDRPASSNDALYEWSIDAEEMLREQAARIAELEAKFEGEPALWQFRWTNPGGRAKPLEPDRRGKVRRTACLSLQRKAGLRGAGAVCLEAAHLHQRTSQKGVWRLLSTRLPVARVLESRRHADAEKSPEFQPTYKENMSVIKIAGIDPSLRNTGVALGHYNLDNGDWQVERIAIVQTERQVSKQVRQNSDDYRCARELIRGVNKLLDGHGATFVFAELPTGAQSARAMFSFGMTTAIMAGLHPAMIQVQPREVQTAALGRAGKDKQAIIEWAVAQWPNAGWMTRKLKGEVKLVADNEHPADACAAIAAGVQTMEFAQALALAAGFRQAA